MSAVPDAPSGSRPACPIQRRCHWDVAPRSRTSTSRRPRWTWAAPDGRSQGRADGRGGERITDRGRDPVRGGEAQGHPEVAPTEFARLSRADGLPLAARPPQPGPGGSHWARSASGPAAGLFVVPAVVVGSGGYSAAHDAQGVQQPGRRVTREKSAAGPCRARRRRTTRPGSYGAKVWAARTAKAVLRSCPGPAARRPGRLGGRSNWRPPPASLTCRYCSAPLAGPGHLLRLRPSASSAYTARAAVRDRSEAMERGRGGARGPGPGLGGLMRGPGRIRAGSHERRKAGGAGCGAAIPLFRGRSQGWSARSARGGPGCRGAGVPGRLYAPVP